MVELYMLVKGFWQCQAITRTKCPAIVSEYPNEYVSVNSSSVGTFLNVIIQLFENHVVMENHF